MSIVTRTAYPDEPGIGDWESEGGATAQTNSRHSDRFVILDRTNGSKVACQVSSIHFLSNGHSGAILHFGGNSQVNVSQSFDEVLALIN